MSTYQGTFRVDETSTVILDANGSGTSYVGPTNSRERWNISTISVASSSTALVPTAQFYRNSAVAGNFITGTFSGSLDVDSTSQISLRSAERLVAVWSGGTPGATCTFRVEGDKILL